MSAPQNNASMPIELWKKMIEPNISTIASLLGNNARTSMLLALMGGKALTATELALEADISCQTASSHLNKLLEHQLIQVRKQGRHKYFQLSNIEVAELLEKLLNISACNSQEKLITGPSDPHLRKARICYDHLAGEIGVALYDSLLKHGYLVEDPTGIVTLTDQGQGFFQNYDADPLQMQALKRPVCKACLDWSERRSHLAGSLGQWILQDVFRHNWASKSLNTRAIHFTEYGLKAFRHRYF